MKKGVKRCIISILITLCIILILPFAYAPAWVSRILYGGNTRTSDVNCNVDGWAQPDSVGLLVYGNGVTIRDLTIRSCCHPIYVGIDPSDAKYMSGGAWVPGKSNVQNTHINNVRIINQYPDCSASRDIEDSTGASYRNYIYYSNDNGAVSLSGNPSAGKGITVCEYGTIGEGYNVDINSGSISVKDNCWSAHIRNSNAHIEFYGITGITNPIIKRNGGACSDCSNVVQSGTTVSFDVTKVGDGTSGTKTYTVVSGCKNNAETCTANSQCCSDQCVDGVCCNTACDSTCQRCDSYDGTAGTCHFVGADNDPDNECNTLNECETSCDAKSLSGVCNGIGACEDYEFSSCIAGTSCQPATGTCEVTSELCDGVDNDCDLIVDEGIPYICENNLFFTINDKDYCFDCNAFSSRAEANISCQSYGMSLASYADGETKQDVVDIISVYNTNIKSVQPIANPSNNVKKGMFIEDDCCEVARTSNSECRDLGYPDNVGVFPKNDADLFWDGGSPGVGCTDPGVISRMVHDGTDGNADGRLNDGCQNCGAVCEVPLLITDGLVSYWSFDAEFGSTNVVAIDDKDDVFGVTIPGPDNDGGVIGDTYMVPGKICAGYEFDGDTDYITVPHDESLDLEYFTLSAWVNISEIDSSIDLSSIIAKGEGKPGQGSGRSNYRLGINSDKNKIKCFFENNDQDKKTVEYDFSQSFYSDFNHIVCTYNQNMFKIYLNGLEVASLSENDAPYTGYTYDVYIGSQYDGKSTSDCLEGDDICRFFNGTIDEVGIWNRSLTNSEVQQLYAMTRPCTANCDGNPIGTTQPCYTGPAGTQDIGICTAGLETCQADGTWTSCIGEVLPQTESIVSGNCGDTLNNDCDLEQDWDYSDLIHGEEDCPIQIIAISVGSPPN